MKNLGNTGDANGTSFHSTVITTTVAKLRKIVGEPAFEQNDGSDKCNFDWVCRTSTGDVFTIYDWKEYRAIEEDEMIEFHIGGHSSSVTEQALTELEEAGV